MESSTLIHELYVSRNNLLDIMESQTYDTTNQRGFSINEINSMYIEDGLDFTLSKSTGKKAYIKYWLQTTLKQQKIQEITEEMFSGDTEITKDDTIIFIVKEEPNDTLKEYIRLMYETENIFIIIHNIKRLLYNLLNHSLVPKCRILSIEEVNQVKKRYNITNDNQFPKLSRFDPLSLVICFRPGEVMELLRSSKTSCITKYYRICVNETSD